MMEPIDPYREELVEASNRWADRCEAAEARVAALEALCAEAQDQVNLDLTLRLRLFRAGRGEEIKWPSEIEAKAAAIERYKARKAGRK